MQKNNAVAPLFSHRLLLSFYSLVFFHCLLVGLFVCVFLKECSVSNTQCEITGCVIGER